MGNKKQVTAPEAVAENAPEVTAPEESTANASETAANQFQHDGKTYEVVIPKMNIPEIGIRTALEVCADPEAQEYLVKVNSAAIKEVVVA